jgi:hypothetical protein
MLKVERRYRRQRAAEHIDQHFDHDLVDALLGRRQRFASRVRLHALAAVVAIHEREQQFAVDGHERIPRPWLHGVEIEARRHGQRREPVAVRRELHLLSVASAVGARA